MGIEPNLLCALWVIGLIFLGLMALGVMGKA